MLFSNCHCAILFSLCRIPVDKTIWQYDIFLYGWHCLFCDSLIPTFCPTLLCKSGRGFSPLGMPFVFPCLLFVQQVFFHLRFRHVKFSEKCAQSVKSLCGGERHGVKLSQRFQTWRNVWLKHLDKTISERNLKQSNCKII